MIVVELVILCLDCWVCVDCCLVLCLCFVVEIVEKVIVVWGVDCWIVGDDVFDGGVLCGVLGGVVGMVWVDVGYGFVCVIGRCVVIWLWWVGIRWWVGLLV